MLVGGTYPAQYSPFGGVAVPSATSCWALLGAIAYNWLAGGPVDYAWATPSDSATMPWVDLTPNSYAAYCLGENFTIVANEEFPMHALEERWLIVPPDSGFTTP